MYICTQQYTFEVVEIRGAGQDEVCRESSVSPFPSFSTTVYLQKCVIRRGKRLEEGCEEGGGAWPKFSIVRGDEPPIGVGASVDPGDGDPLGGGGHQVYGLLQQPDGVVDLVVDDGLVKVVAVGPLQHLGFLLEPLERVILRVWWEGGRREGQQFIQR